MAFFEWDSRYSVHVAEIDRQHRRLIDLINQLHEGMEHDGRQGSAATALDELDTLGTVLEELIDYTLYHFSMEEDHMREYAYPQRTGHENAHAQFIDRVRTFRRDFADGKAVASTEIMRFLRQWLKVHIASMDKKLGWFLNEKGLR